MIAVILFIGNSEIDNFIESIYDNVPSDEQSVEEECNMEIHSELESQIPINDTIPVGDDLFSTELSALIPDQELEKNTGTNSEHTDLSMDSLQLKTAQILLSSGLSTMPPEHSESTVKITMNSTSNDDDLLNGENSTDSAYQSREETVQSDDSNISLNENSSMSSFNEESTFSIINGVLDLSLPSKSTRTENDCINEGIKYITISKEVPKLDQNKKAPNTSTENSDVEISLPCSNNILISNSDDLSISSNILKDSTNKDPNSKF